MPTYDYKCGECGHIVEVFHSMKADHLTICPACGKPALKRLMTGGAGMIFKGSGFYLTDYGKSGSDKPSSESTSKKTKDTSDKPESSSSPGAKSGEKKETPSATPKSPPPSDSKKD